MKRSKLILGLTVLIIGLLAVGCGGAEQNSPATNDNGANGQQDISDPTNDLEEPVSSDDELPVDSPQEGPIINLPGEIKYQDRDRGEGQAALSEGNAFVSSVDIVTMESFPIQVALEIAGELPTPCNQLTVDISSPNDQNQIFVDVYSLVDPAMTCIAMIEPFAARVSLPVEDLAEGTYEVWVNGTLEGWFTYPG